MSATANWVITKRKAMCSRKWKGSSATGAIGARGEGTRSISRMTGANDQVCECGYSEAVGVKEDGRGW